MLDSAVDREALKNIAIENDAGRHAVVEGFHGLEKGGWTANFLQDTIGPVLLTVSEAFVRSKKAA